MKVAIPIFRERVAPAFDWAGRLLLVEVDRSGVVRQSDLEMVGVTAHERAALLVDLAVEVLICGGISTPVTARLQAQGIHVLPGIAGNVGEVLEAFVAGSLGQPQWTMPGWCGRMGRGRGRGGRGPCGRGGGWRGGRGWGAGPRGG